MKCFVASMQIFDGKKSENDSTEVNILFILK